MGYNHTRVDGIEQATKDVLALEAVSNTAVHKVDGIPVLPELVQFCAEIRKVSRHVKFGVSKRTQRLSSNVYAELYAYMDEHIYAMMKIGYGDHSVGSNNSPKFVVYARVIANEKFKEDRKQYYMAAAENIERAIRNVKKYMRPYSPIECAAMSFEAVRSKFTLILSNASTGMVSARHKLFESAHLRHELFHMLDVGYEFLSEEFKNTIVDWREAYREDQASKARALHLYYVNVRIARQEMVCDVIEVLDAHKHYTIKDRVNVVTTYKMEELPDNIAGGIATLSMVKDNHYVDGVGLRVDSATFWVQR